MPPKSYHLNEHRFLFTEFDGEGVLFDIETNEYLNLNETFCTIFKLLRDGKGLAEIKESLLKEFDVEESVCETEVKNTVEELKRRGLIHEKAFE